MTDEHEETSDDETVQLPLPGWRWIPIVEAPPLTGKYGAARVKTTRLCDWCCDVIDELGMEAAPVARKARWRITARETADLVLCEMHMIERVKERRRKL